MKQNNNFIEKLFLERFFGARTNRFLFLRLRSLGAISPLADLRLENAIRAAICDLPEMYDLRSNVTIETDFETGSVVMTGVVGTRRVAAKIEERAAQVNGVQSVENRIIAKPVLV